MAYGMLVRPRICTSTPQPGTFASQMQFSAPLNSKLRAVTYIVMPQTRDPTHRRYQRNRHDHHPAPPRARPLHHRIPDILWALESRGHWHSLHCIARYPPKVFASSSLSFTRRSASPLLRSEEGPNLVFVTETQNTTQKGFSELVSASPKSTCIRRSVLQGASFPLHLPLGMCLGRISNQVW